MDYEEKYKKSLDRAMNLFVANNISATAVCEIFPELNESEEVNYEKKYKEALEWMRSVYDGLHGATKEDAEHYFPELKESEDERIRREIIDFLRLPHPQFVGKRDHELWIAWLEKNKRKFEESEISITESQPEPKFKVGDKVTMKGDNTIYTIGIIAPDKTCWLKHGSREYGWATFSVLKHYVE